MTPLVQLRVNKATFVKSFFFFGEAGVIGGEVKGLSYGENILCIKCVYPASHSIL